MRIFLCQNGPSLSFASLPKLSSQPTVVTLTRACLNTHTAFGRGEPEFLSPFLELLSTPTMSLLQTHNSGSRWPTSQAASRAKLMIITQRTLCAPLYVSGRWRLHNYLFSTCVVLHPTIHKHRPTSSSGTNKDVVSAISFYGHMLRLAQSYLRKTSKGFNGMKSHFRLLNTGCHSLLAPLKDFPPYGL